MSDAPTISTWRGVRLEDCTREQLLDCIRYLGNQYNETTSPSAIRANAIGRAEMIRRGEVYQ